MKKKIAVLSAVIAAAAISQADLIHRYVFSNNVTDVVGSVNGTATTANTYLEAPTYVTAAPTGSTGPDMAMSVGANVGTLKSGFTIANTVLKTSGTVALWFKPDSTANTRYVFTAGLAKGFSLLQTAATNSIRAAVVTTENAGRDMTYTGTHTDWHFYAITWEKDTGSGTGSATVYLDGHSESFTFSSANWTPTAITFGNFGLANNTNSIGNQFDGLLYDVQVYDAKASSSEINYLKDNPGTVIPEPATIGMLGLGALVTMSIRHKLHF